MPRDSEVYTKALQASPYVAAAVGATGVGVGFYFAFIKRHYQHEKRETPFLDDHQNPDQFNFSTQHSLPEASHSTFVDALKHLPIECWMIVAIAATFALIVAYCCQHDDTPKNTSSPRMR